ncbi:hypothetical protein BC937DRAFT_89621 [Endogone sp. FLAS-F59071]|nr:hypothetical protein BC937DRAFT_89621 [Endogone sp. FLAS-F59071]|eukprot:RUS22348.1 hypothetical protein BC937DRAFT_89621 [Endogone sp. FLAS-F59071]
MDKSPLVSDITLPGKRIFDGVVFFLNPALGPTRCAELNCLLCENGATEALPPPSRPATDAEYLNDDESTQDGSVQVGTMQDETQDVTAQDEKTDSMGPGIPRFDPARTTHVITADEDFPEREAVREARIAVVTLPKKDREALFGGVSAFGGQFRSGLTLDVTHLVSLAPEGEKYQKVMEHPELGIKVVLPHWFDDCFKLKRLVREHMYLFPDPPLLRPDLWASSESNSATTVAALTATTISHTTNTLSLLPSSSQLQASSGTAPTSQLPPPMLNPTSVNTVSLTTMPYEGHIFPVPSNTTPIPEPSTKFLSGMRFYLCDDLHNRALRATFEERLKQAGAVVVSQGSPYQRKEVDCFVGKYREGDTYVQACRDGKVIGSLFWLQHMFHTERMENPKDQLLDYPQPKEKIPEFENFIITISNYTGAAREHIKRLIHNLGGAYTPHMTPANTHVICASPTGDKYAKALEWNTHIVNHLWLEECYQSWTCRSVADARYTFFAEGVRMEDLVGRTPVLSAEVERWWKPLPEEEEGESTDDGTVHGRQRPESQSESDDAVTGPLAARPLGTGSVTTVSKQPRQAAVQAADALHEVYMPDAVAYEKEKRTPRKGMKASSAGSAGKRERDDDDEGGEEDREEIKRKVKTKKRNSMEDDEDAEARDDMEEEEAEQGELEEQGNQTLSKKVTLKKDKGGKKAVVARARSTSLSESTKEKTKKGKKVEVVDTSVNTTPTKGRPFLKSAGARLADTPHECTHLITKHVARTEKFLSCVSVAQYILTPDWIAESIAQGRLVDETPYVLRDTDAEKQYQFKLTTSLERAREGKLMEGKEVYVTPKTHPSKETVKEIVECAGGKLITTVSLRKLRDGAASNSLIILSCEEDRDRWKDFRAHGLPVHSPELLLTGVLRQELDVDAKEFKLAG